MARAQDTRPEAMREVIERFMTCSPYPKAISAIAFTWISAEQSKKVPKRFSECRLVLDGSLLDFLVEP
jgi:hypothetical protein